MAKKIPQQIGKPNFIPSGLLYLYLEDCGGYEGIKLLLRSELEHGSCADILATDEEGNVWVGESHSVLLGTFKYNGEFKVNPKIEALG